MKITKPVFTERFFFFSLSLRMLFYWLPIFSTFSTTLSFRYLLHSFYGYRGNSLLISLVFFQPRMFVSFWFYSYIPLFILFLFSLLSLFLYFYTFSSFKFLLISLPPYFLDKSWCFKHLFQCFTLYWFPFLSFCSFSFINIHIFVFSILSLFHSFLFHSFPSSSSFTDFSFSFSLFLSFIYFLLLFLCFFSFRLHFFTAIYFVLGFFFYFVSFLFLFYVFVFHFPFRNFVYSIIRFLLLGWFSFPFFLFPSFLLPFPSFYFYYNFRCI